MLHYSPAAWNKRCKQFFLTQTRPYLRKHQLASPPPPSCSGSGPLYLGGSVPLRPHLFIQRRFGQMTGST